jgi:hypothetical protein
MRSKICLGVKIVNVDLRTWAKARSKDIQQSNEAVHSMSNRNSTNHVCMVNSADVGALEMTFEVVFVRGWRRSSRRRLIEVT